MDASTTGAEASEVVSDSKAPKWISQPFTDLLNDLARQRELLHIAKNGIASLQSAPLVAEAAARVRKEKFSDDARKRAKAEAELARREVEEGFPVLHCQAVIAIWHTLENNLRRVLVAWLHNEPSAAAVEPVKKVKIKFGDFLALSEEERMFYVADQMDHELSGPLKLGVGRFETLFDPFGFSGSLDELVRKSILELQQIRNVLVHRGGRADRQLLERCPWLPFKFGDLIPVTAAMVEKYHSAVFIYAMELCIRFGKHFGSDTQWCSDMIVDELSRLRKFQEAEGEH